MDSIDSHMDAHTNDAICLFIPGAFHLCTAQQVQDAFHILFGDNIIDKVDESLRSANGKDFKHFWIHFKSSSPALDAFVHEIKLKGVRTIIYNEPYFWKVQMDKPKV